ncbi:hypothetical protein PUN28_007786 [Cardiocondyla obscurior]|uniref:Uncharacterized protein n=1 Tax=Cardiocondyla obscurior TaxID=286306 RepID=A0AAW2FZE8_9HYME
MNRSIRRCMRAGMRHRSPRRTTSRSRNDHARANARVTKRGRGCSKMIACHLMFINCIIR